MGTFDSTAFKDKQRSDGKRDIYFNGPGDGGNHGHVVQNGDGSYDHVRDVEGRVYVDNGKSGNDK